MYRALALAMLGRFDEGRPLLVETRAELAERGGGIRLAVTTGIESVDFELLAGKVFAGPCADRVETHDVMRSQRGDSLAALPPMGSLYRKLSPIKPVITM